MGSGTDDLLINDPLALVDRLFGPERQILPGHWQQFHELAAPMYVDEELVQDEGADDAVDAEGELCP